MRPKYFCRYRRWFRHRRPRPTWVAARKSGHFLAIFRRSRVRRARAFFRRTTERERRPLPRRGAARCALAPRLALRDRGARKVPRAAASRSPVSPALHRRRRGCQRRANGSSNDGAATKNVCVAVRPPPDRRRRTPPATPTRARLAASDHPGPWAKYTARRPRLHRARVGLSFRS